MAGNVYERGDPVKAVLSLIISLGFACHAEQRETPPVPFFGDQDFLAILRWAPMCDQPLDMKLRCTQRTRRTDCLYRQLTRVQRWHRSTTFDYKECADLDGDAQDVRGLNEPWDCQPASYQVACRSLPGWEIDVSKRGVVTEVCVNASRGQLFTYARQVLPSLVGWIRAAILVGLIPVEGEPLRSLGALWATRRGSNLGYPFDRVCYADQCQYWNFPGCGDTNIK